MPIHVPNNLRERGSRITNAEILRPGDALELWGIKFMARLAILDSHDPIAEAAAGSRVPAFLPNHHHVLIAPDDDDYVLSGGLYVRQGSAQDLFFNHTTGRQWVDPRFIATQDKFMDLVDAGLQGLFYVSDNERLSSTPEGQAYLNQAGGLLR